MTYTQVWDYTRNQVHDGIIVRDEDGAFIPFDEANIDYQDYLAWLDEGNEPTPYTSPSAKETPEQVPIRVTTTRTITKGNK
jgi:hypothetical protein